MSKLILILGDQLCLNNPALSHFDAKNDKLLMIEAVEESTHVWSHKTRIVYFLSAMRHFAQRLRDQYGEHALDYWALDQHSHARLVDALAAAITQHCRFKPKEKSGTNACPITQLYWRFLIIHFDELSHNPRTSLMVSHVKKLSDSDKQQLVREAERHLS